MSDPTRHEREQGLFLTFIAGSWEGFDWSVHGSALRGVQAVKDIRALLDYALSLLSTNEAIERERDEHEIELSARFRYIEVLQVERNEAMKRAEKAEATLAAVSKLVEQWREAASSREG